MCRWYSSKKKWFLVLYTSTTAYMEARNLAASKEFDNTVRHLRTFLTKSFRLTSSLHITSKRCEGPSAFLKRHFLPNFCNRKSVSDRTPCITLDELQSLARGSRHSYASHSRTFSSFQGDKNTWESPSSPKIRICSGLSLLPCSQSWTRSISSSRGPFPSQINSSKKECFL